MLRWSALLVVASLASLACKTAAPSREPRADVMGDYEFIANLQGRELRGTMRVMNDTVLVEPQGAYCQPTPTTPDPLKYQFTCTGDGAYESLLLRVDRRNPAQFSGWQALVRVRKTRQVCTQYATNAQGQQVCVASRTETYEATETRSGRLQVRRLTDLPTGTR